ncbi:propionyl-CoA synthetase [Spirochaetota bacterium]|nr:propionyl-CoA synthetase [Spirochaetota bacterium]
MNEERFAKSYRKEYENSINDPAAYWGKQAQAITWFKPPEVILTKNDKGLYRWFADGVLNTCYLALDHHIEAGRGDNRALIYDSPVTQTKKTYTFTELHDAVARFAGALHAEGLKKGERVIIYMPMIPEAVIAMLACARLGAVHSVVFGGFAPQELASRITHAKPRFIITASCGIEVNKVVDYMAMVRMSVTLAEHRISGIIVKQREEAPATLNEPLEKDFNSLLSTGEKIACTEVKATDPLYILYTSGTTGKPKGIVRDNGGHAVALKYSMDVIYDTKCGEVFWAASDIGWVVGHSYIVYAPLFQGCTTIVYEGKPVRTPDPSAFYRVIAEHNVTSFFTAPTAFRAIKKEDPEGNYAKKHHASSLKYIFSAGERLDPPTYKWLTEIFPKQKIIDNWWQTETGWPIVANLIGLESYPPKIGSATFPVPGFNVQIMSDEGELLPQDVSGNIVIKLPLPPSCLPTLWEDDALFKKVYLDFAEGYYLSGDGGYKDEEGYVFVMGRTDDVINVAGHRFSTGEIEEVIGSHQVVAECAVIGIIDAVKGTIPLALVVLKDGSVITEDALEKELTALVRSTLGAVIAFKQAIVVKRLPKTRSGKILRKTLRLISEHEKVPAPPTIDDPAIIDEIRTAFSRRKVGIFVS